MIEFKRVNIINLSNRYNCKYFLLDVIRQTAVKRIVDYVNRSDMFKDTDKKQFIDSILSNVRLVLDKMILDCKDKKE